MINIQSDSRKIKPGDTFIAVKCEVNDGHKYIESAIKNGASKVIAERGEYDVDTLIVPDTREYLEKYLQDNYNKYLDEMTIIGITGTNGKTTSAYLLYQTLNDLGVKTAYIGTIGFYLEEKVMDLPNTSVDICDTYDLIMKAYDKGFKVVVLEASSQALHSGRLRSLRFDYAIFTNLTQDHLDYHKTMGNYALAKQILFKQLKPSGKAIINSDDKYKEYFLLNENNNITYGFKDADIYVKDYKMTQNETEFTYVYNKKAYKTHIKLLGKYNLYNVLDVIATLSAMGIKQNKIVKYLPTLKAPVGRMQLVKYKSNNIIIDYAHTPDAIENIITSLKDLIKGDIYVVFGCTGDRDRLKRPIMTEYIANNSKHFIITNDDPHYEDPAQIVNDMTKDLTLSNYEVCLDREEAIIRGIKLLKENDTLFILGKGHEENMIIKDKKVPFNDYKVVINYLDRLGDD